MQGLVFHPGIKGLSAKNKSNDLVAVGFEQMNNSEFVNQVNARFLAHHNVDHGLPTIQSETFCASVVKERDE
jgi:hypothetical protein